MASRQEQARTNFVVGLFVLAMGGILIFSLFLIAVSEGALERKTTLTADFRTVSGLTNNSKVQLAGKEIGRVQDVAFIAPVYPCNPLTEDMGRTQDGRTDDCDPSLFCAQMENGTGQCVELEDYQGSPELYTGCNAADGCAAGQVCMTLSFRHRYPQVRWAGEEGWCVPWDSELRRVQVTMEIAEDKLAYIREDSRATIASNGVLGDQLVNLTVGTGAKVEAGGRIQSTPSIMEELNLFKERADQITQKVDRSLAGVAGLFDSLNDDRTKRDLKGLLTNAAEISRQIKDGDGLVGAMFNDRDMRSEFSMTLRSVRHSADHLEGTLGDLREEVKPAVNNASRAAKSISELVDVVNDPENGSVVARAFHDDKLGEDVGAAVSEASEAVGAARQTLTDVQILVAEVRHAVTSGEGTLGKLIKDPKAYDDLVKLLGNIERENMLKALVRFALEQDEAASSAAPPR